MYIGSINGHQLARRNTDSNR